MNDAPPLPDPAWRVSTTGPWSVCLLGQVSAQRGDAVHRRWPSRAVASLMASLALEPDRAHAREALIERLWPGVAPDVGRNRLRQALSTLRTLLEPAGSVADPVLIADRHTVRVAPGSLECDVRRFEQHAARGALEEALALYRGELMPGFYDDWVVAERARLEAIRERLATVRPRAPPPGAGASAVFASTDELPHYLTRLFGRAAAIEALTDAVAAHRLVTLTGPGGIGKTRLAVEAGRRLVGRAPFDQVGFVPLVGCSTRAQLFDALLSRLRAPGEGEPLDRLRTAVHGRSVLLVLDNFEQLVDAAGDALSELLARVPGLHLLVTSRRVLGLDGERQVELQSLELPGPDLDLDAAAGNPAVALFVDRARLARSDFHLGARNREALLALVRRLDGLPLALELAASRVRSIAPADMLEMLARAPAERGDLLARRGTRAGLDPRHASMQAVVAWSWSLLDADQRALLGALVPFDGGCSAAAAGAVAAVEDPALQLHGLVEHSLIEVRAGASGATRYRPFEPVREFAATRSTAEQARALRGRHRDWMFAWARGLPLTPSLPEVRDEWDNVAAALGSAVADDDPTLAVELLVALRRVIEDLGLPDAALASATLAVQRCADPALAACGRTVLAPALLRAGRGAQALDEAQQAAAALAAGTPCRAQAQYALARMTWRVRRDPAAVLPLIDEAEACAAPDDHALQAALAALRGFVEQAQQRDPDQVRALHERALALWRRTGNRYAALSGEYNLAVADQNRGCHAEALERLQPLIAEARALADWCRLSEARNVAGNALGGLRRWAEAAAEHRAAVEVAWAHGTAYELAYPLWNLPRALAHLGEPEAAVQLAAFAARFWTDRFGVLGARDQRDLRRVRRLACVQIGRPAVAAAWQAGEAMRVADALALARRHPQA